MKVSKNYKIGLIDPQSEIESLYLDFIANYEPANTDQILCEMTKEQIYDIIQSAYFCTSYNKQLEISTELKHYIKSWAEEKGLNVEYF